MIEIFIIKVSIFECFYVELNYLILYYIWKFKKYHLFIITIKKTIETINKNIYIIQMIILKKYFFQFKSFVSSYNF